MLSRRGNSHAEIRAVPFTPTRHKQLQQMLAERKTVDAYQLFVKLRRSLPQLKDELLEFTSLVFESKGFIDPELTLLFQPRHTVNDMLKVCRVRTYLCERLAVCDNVIHAWEKEELIRPLFDDDEQITKCEQDMAGMERMRRDLWYSYSQCPICRVQETHAELSDDLHTIPDNFLTLLRTQAEQSITIMADDKAYFTFDDFFNAFTKYITLGAFSSWALQNPLAALTGVNFDVLYFDDDRQTLVQKMGVHSASKVIASEFTADDWQRVYEYVYDDDHANATKEAYRIAYDHALRLARRLNQVSSN